MTPTTIEAPNPLLSLVMKHRLYTYDFERDPSSPRAHRWFRRHGLARRCLVRRYSWAVPDPNSLSLIAKYSPLVEMGAGTGYWASLLATLGVDILCFDSQESHNVARNYGRWYPVRPGDPTILLDHWDLNLFLCWPPYDTRMAYLCLQRWKGRYLIYIGEDEGGCNATDSFFRRLNREFNLIESATLTQFYGLHDSLSIYERKPTSQGAPQ
jgi:hypothetical protein